LIYRAMLLLKVLIYWHHFQRESADGAFLIAYAQSIDEAEPVLINTSAALMRVGIHNPRNSGGQRWRDIDR
jgi:hypothetical protein